MADKPEPRFDRDYAYGRQGELQINEFLEWIAAGNGQVECKRKRYLDLCFYVETDQKKPGDETWTPSGISVTTAAGWAFVIGDTGITVLFPTDELRAMLDDPSTLDRQQLRGDYRTRGKVVNLAVLLYRHRQRDARK